VKTLAYYAALAAGGSELAGVSSSLHEAPLSLIINIRNAYQGG